MGAVINLQVLAPNSEFHGIFLHRRSNGIFRESQYFGFLSYGIFWSIPQYFRGILTDLQAPAPNYAFHGICVVHPRSNGICFHSQYFGFRFMVFLVDAHSISAWGAHIGLIGRCRFLAPTGSPEPPRGSPKEMHKAKIRKRSLDVQTKVPQKKQLKNVQTHSNTS